jgi:hypothetical protein
MGQATRRIQSRRKARVAISNLLEHADQVIVIHYSCESFYDRIDGSSPRITSIAVRNLDTAQTTSFSIHQMAERKRCDLAALEQHYNQLEKQMLDEFYEFVKINQNYMWIHWNMRDINYGFPAIAHRYRVLRGKPVEIDNSKLYDLSRILIDLYGVKYINHPRLESLVEKNKITKQDFLNGKEEAKAFENKQYVKLHQSTLRKVDIFANILDRLDTGILETNAKWRDIYGNYPQSVWEIAQEKWWILAILAIIGLVADISGVIDIISWFR